MVVIDGRFYEVWRLKGGKGFRECFWRLGMCVCICYLFVVDFGGLKVVSVVELYNWDYLWVFGWMILEDVVIYLNI